MRRTEDASGSRSRRPRVRWEDDEIAAKATRQSMNMPTTQPRSPLRPTPRMGWGGSAPSPSESAAATLSMYLSEALEGGHTAPLMAPSPQRRTTPPRADSVLLRQDKPNQREDIEEAPVSPLSRFLKKRDGASFDSPMRGFSGASRLGGINEEKRRVTTGANAGTMERLLMEKIREAKLMRESRAMDRSESNQENRQPNGVFFSSRPGMTTATAVEESHFPTVVPTPHPKPVKPQLPQRATSLSEPDTKKVSCNSEQIRLESPELELTLVATRAARCIQTAWRKQSLGKLKESVPALRQSNERPQAAQSLSDETAVKAEEEAIVATASSPVKLPEVMTTPDSAAVVRSTVHMDHSQEAALIHHDPPVEEPHARAVMWADDECVLLEEGRVPTFELLDPAALEVDTSLEALVRTKPHVVAEIQETARRERELTRRASRRPTESHIQALERLEPTTTGVKDVSSHSSKQKVSIRVVLQRRLRLPSDRSKTKHQRGRPRHCRIRIGYRHADTEPTALNEQANADTDDASARELLEHLSRYVVFSDNPQSEQMPGEDRNDLIRVGEATVVDAEDVARARSETDRGDDASGAIASSGHLINISSVSSEYEEDHPGLTSVSEAARRASPSHLSQLNESTPPSSAASPKRHADRTLGLFPTLRQTEFEVKCALDRIHAQYSLDQQRLIDAYADDAIFTTFFSPPPSPLDSDERHPSLLECAPTPVSAEPSEDSYGSSTAFNTAKQQEFLQALDEFRESLRASMASTPLSQSTSAAGFEIHDPPAFTAFQHDEEEQQDQDDENCSTKSDDAGVDVDAELQAMLQEIQRCKTQIALARRQPPSSYARSS